MESSQFIEFILAREKNDKYNVNDVKDRNTNYMMGNHSKKINKSFERIEQLQ